MTGSAEVQRCRDAVGELFGLARSFLNQTARGPDDVMTDRMRNRVTHWLQESQGLLTEGTRDTYPMIKDMLDAPEPWLLREAAGELEAVARALCRKYGLNPADYQGGGQPSPLIKPSRTVTVHLTQRQAGSDRRGQP